MFPRFDDQMTKSSGRTFSLPKTIKAPCIMQSSSSPGPDAAAVLLSYLTSKPSCTFTPEGALRNTVQSSDLVRQLIETVCIASDGYSDAEVSAEIQEPCDEAGQNETLISAT